MVLCLSETSPNNYALVVHNVDSVKNLTLNVRRPASWASGQSFWLLITRSRVRFPTLTWGFSLWGGRIPLVTMVWVDSRFRLKVETSATRSQKSNNSD